MKVPTKPDIFGLHSIIDYEKLFSFQSGEPKKHKVIKAKKVFTTNSTKNYSRKMLKK